jgi:hypothetical protein
VVSFRMGEERKPAAEVATQGAPEATGAVDVPIPLSAFPTGNGTSIRHPDDWSQADPGPPTPGTTAGDLFAGTAAVAGFVALDVVTGGLFSMVTSLPGGFPRSGDTYDGPPLFVPPGLHGTAAPAVDAEGLVACTRCQRRVPYASMALNEHGYFCARCGPSRPL